METRRRWRYARTVLLVVVAANVAQLGNRLILSPVVPEIIEAFSATKSTVGLALTGMWVAYALFQFPGGVLASRYGERRTLLASLVLVTLAGLLISVSPTFLAFGAFVFLLGGGGALFFPSAGPLLAKLYDNTGFAFGVLTAGAAVAGLVGPVAAAWVGVRYGWRVVPLLGAAASALVFGLLLWRVRPTEADRPELSVVAELTPNRGQLDLLTRPRVAFSIAIALTGSFSFQAFTSFFPTFLIEFRGFTTEQAGLAFGGVFLLSAAIQPVVGRASDAVGRDLAIGAAMLATAFGLLSVMFAPVLGLVVASLVVLGAGFTWFGAINARFMDALGEAERGVGFGLIRTAALLLGAPGSVVTGYVVDTAGWVPAYGLVAGLLLTSCVLLAANALLDVGL